MLLGLRTVVYPAPELEAAKQAAVALFGVQPYFDQPFYVGFELAGYEFGLDPNADPAAGPTTYWGVPDVAAAVATYTARGATIVDPPQDTGDGIRTVTLDMPPLGRIGFIENPIFAAVDVQQLVGPDDGPGR